MDSEKKQIEGKGLGLREKAETLLTGRPIELSGLSLEDAQYLIRELQVQQIELKFQNEALRQAQQELEQSRSQYVDLYDFAPVGYFAIDEQGLIVEANLTGATMLAVERSTLIRRPFAHFVAKEHQDIYYSWQQTLLVTQTSQTCEIEMVRNDGTRFDACLEGIAVVDSAGCVAQSRLVVSDISGRKQTEAFWQEGQKRYKQLLEAVTDYIYTVEVERGQAVSTTHSPGCVAVTGYTSQEYEADPNLWYRMIYEEDQARVTQQIANVLAGTNVDPFEHRIIHKDGTTRWVKNTWVPRYDDFGKLIAYDGLITNVTERKQAEEALAKERNLLRALVDNLPDYIYVKDTQSRFLLANEAVKRHLGAATIDDVVGKTDFDFSPIDLAKMYYADEQALFQSNRPLISHEEKVYDHESNTFRWVSATKVPFHNSRGDIIGLVGLNRDISVLKRAEEAYQMLVEHSLQGLAILQDERIGFANPMAAQITGYTVAELLSLTPNDVRAVIHPEDQPIIVAHWQDRLADELLPPRFEARIIRQDDQIRWIEIYASRIEYQGRPAVQVAYIDITERKQAEETLKMHARVLESMVEGVNVSDEKGVIYFTNPAFDTMFGYEPGELIGQHVSVLEVGSTEQKSQYVEEISEHLQASGVWFGEFKNRKKNGTPFITQARISLLEMPDKKYRVSVQEDITERRKAEEETTRLFDAIARQREQLRALARRLNEIQEAERKDLARELHDQVGQSLTALGLNLNIIRAQIPENIPDSALLYNRIDDSLMLTEQTTERIRDVMANLRPPVLDDYGLVAALHWYGQRFASWGGFKVVIEGEEFKPRLKALVENALFRIVQEALTNVAKHARASQVTISVDETDGIVCLLIIDDGLGFDNTFLAQPIGKRGWGLLSMIERAEAIGGYCQIDSSPNHGTQIMIEVAR